MDPEKQQFLNLRIKPGRICVRETSWLLGYTESEIPVLVARKLLRPLSPTKNGVRYFALSEIERLHGDSKWHDRATATIREHWRRKNERRNEPHIVPHASFGGT